ncbi:MAG: glycoside hydrolase family 3 protein [Butyribacter sp.]|nr:glycoside hydrolase family 3 protein [bacterium]MDY3854044.1 glycoside hydrolase family 3 protein [Butyribacter sp.]
MKNPFMKKICAVALTIAVSCNLSGCITFFGSDETSIKTYESSSEVSSEETQEEETTVMEWEDAMELASEYMKNMTLEEKVGQIFVVNLEQLDTRKGNFYEFRKCTKTMVKNIQKYHVGGVILFSRNIAKRNQTIKMTEGLKNADKIPLFIAVDEEGGRVSRIASNKKMKTTVFPSAEEIGKTKDDQYTYDMGKTIGLELGELGFNVDFAPVADVKTSELNKEIGDRSFGEDPDKVGEYVSAFVQGLNKVNISGTLKHFPGQGSSEGDTHKGSVDIDSSIAQLRKTDFVPFQKGIAAGADFVMVSHISVSKVTESSIPASMSNLIMQTILRDELGFEKIIITDAFDMTSIIEEYSAAEAAYNAFHAGADIILMPENLEEAYDEILYKVQSDENEQKRLNDSVLRILAVKIQRGILS